jgi:methylmalonyl-CoA mutase
LKNFFDEFPSDKTKSAWMEEVLKDLKGKTYDKIWWKTYEGFELEPYYKGFEIENINIPDDVPGEFPYARGNKPAKAENTWSVRQEIKCADAKKAAKDIDEAVKGGAAGIDMKLNCGVKPFAKIFGDVNHSKIQVNIEAGASSKEIFELISSKLDKKSNGSIDNDPLKELALNGYYENGEKKRYAEMKEIFDACLELPGFKGTVISNLHFHDSGATISQKIAYLLSTAVYYKEKIAPKLSFKEFSENIGLSYGIGQYYLLEIAGLRSLRQLWSNLALAYDKKGKIGPVDIHAKTGLINKTVYDPFVNMLRTTTEAMSAINGGCNSLTVLPYDVCIKESDTFSNRIARNTQLVLKEESHFDRFVDPAKGSYYIEKATDLISKDAWAIFQKIEAAGGMYEALKNGIVQNELAELKKKRLSNFSGRRDTLVGTNLVPNYSETAGLINKKAVKVKVTKKAVIETIKPFRLAEEFEAHRMLTEKYAKENKKPVTAFLATIGNLTMRKARASFAMGYLSAGGFNIMDNNGFKDADEAVKAALKSKSEIVVICSSDEEYPVIAPEIASKLKKADPKIVVVLAGFPKEIIDSLKKAGVDEFIHLRSDSIETIKSIQTKLGIIK